MSQFESELATRKRADRKKRQRFLKEQIDRYKMANFTFADAYRLFRFFSLPEPSDIECREAALIIEAHMADIDAFWREFNAMP